MALQRMCVLVEQEVTCKALQQGTSVGIQNVMNHLRGAGRWSEVPNEPVECFGCDGGNSMCWYPVPTGFSQDDGVVVIKLKKVGRREGQGSSLHRVYQSLYFILRFSFVED